MKVGDYIKLKNISINKSINKDIKHPHSKSLVYQITKCQDGEFMVYYKTNRVGHCYCTEIRSRYEVTKPEIGDKVILYGKEDVIAKINYSYEIHRYSFKNYNHPEAFFYLSEFTLFEKGRDHFETVDLLDSIAEEI